MIIMYSSMGHTKFRIKMLMGTFGHWTNPHIHVLIVQSAHCWSGIFSITVGMACLMNSLVNLILGEYFWKVEFDKSKQSKNSKNKLLKEITERENELWIITENNSSFKKQSTRKTYLHLNLIRLECKDSNKLKKRKTNFEWCLNTYIITKIIITV